MSQMIEVRVAPGEHENHGEVLRRALAKASLPETHPHCRIARRSIDARGRHPVYVFQVEIYGGADEYAPVVSPDYRQVHNAPEVHIAGAGPAGYFAALELLAMGLKPVILERGKDVRGRRRDLRAIQQFGQVNPDSNYCFGEGGAGTYSDGKLYTRSKKRGDIQQVLRILVDHGADPDIMIDAHPHIGSNKLPNIISRVRATIEAHGGEVRFGHRLTGFAIGTGQLNGVRVNHNAELPVAALILATGHSARDVYTLLVEAGVSVEFKPFALGVRIEHPQALIDEIRYKQHPRDPGLPAASYGASCQVGRHGVFSFCMCPGGLIVPAATSSGEIVLNGMSLSRRDSPFANAGTVVTVDSKDIAEYAAIDTQQDPLGGMAFQRQIEQRCFALGDTSQQAPAQRLSDFLEGRASGDLPETSYIPGLFAADLEAVFPVQLVETLRAGIRDFGKRMRGYLTNEAVVAATESRTSAPVRIPRNPDDGMHPQIRGLFPCGEGAGYAGGIVSAAVDGRKTARAVARLILQRSPGC